MTPNASAPSSSQAHDPASGILAFLLERGFKRTHALVCLLREMAADPHPRTLAEWGDCPSLQERSGVTLYRLMLKLEQAGVVRRVNLGERAQCFQLLLTGPAPDYLVCTSCGGLKQVETPLEVRVLEESLAQKTGWKAVRHELEFFGVCPSCAEHNVETGHPANSNAK